MKIKKLNEDIQHCWFGYYIDKDGNQKYFYMTKDSTSSDPDEASDIMENSIPEPFTKFVFQGSVANTQAEKQGWKLVESKESEESELITQYINNGEFDKLEKVHNGTNVVWKLKEPITRIDKSKSITEGWSGDEYKGYSILLDDDSINWDAEQVRLVWRILDKDGNKVGSVAGQANARKYIDNLPNQYIGKKVEIDLQDTTGLDEEGYQLLRKYNNKVLEIVGFYDGEGTFKESSWDISDGVDTLEGVSGTLLSLVESINESKSTHCVYFNQDGRDQIEFEGTEDECNRYISAIQAEQDDEFGDEAPERYIKRLHESKPTHYVYFSLDGGKTQEIEFEGTEDECQDYIEKQEADNEFGDEAPERFIKRLTEASASFQKEFYCDYVILRSRVGDGWDIYSYDGTPEKVTKAYLEDEGFATLQAAKDEIDKWNDEAKLDESIEDFANITSIADECGENTHKVSSRDIRFRFVNEDDETKFINKLYELNIPYTQAAYGVIISKSSALDESKVSDFPENSDAGEWLRALLLDQDMEMSNVEILDHYIMPNYADFTIRHDGDTTKYRIHRGGKVTIKENLNEASTPLYIIKDNHGNQLSAPNPDDNELWDRVASMEARGRTGLSVVAYVDKTNISEGPYIKLSEPQAYIDELDFAGAVEIKGNKVYADEETLRQLAGAIAAEYGWSVELKEELSEASYGGAFDIADDQFFTREDIENAAEEVMGHITETFTEPYHLGGTWFENGQWIVNVQGEQFDEYEISLPIDMRKIKEPWHLKRAYANEMAAKLIGQIKEYNDMNEAITPSSFEFDDDVDDLSYYYDDEQLKSGYMYIKSKSVPDSDGFMTDYTMYQDIESGEYVFVFGDNEVYTPENSEFDHECETAEEADEWFDNYNGFEDMDEGYPKHKTLEEAYDPYDPADGWTEEDIALHKSIDWKARNYTPYVVEDDTFEGEVVAYGLPGGPQKARVTFAKELSPNPIFSPVYKPTSNPFEHTVGFMYDGHKHNGYLVMDRTETQDVYDMLSH